ncbi:rhombosortase [Neptunicella marina]|uniref:rhombosortase n=1 Tax=Neptunicella marina TaxID=2125989 RepID=UPI0030CA3489
MKKTLPFSQIILPAMITLLAFFGWLTAPDSTTWFTYDRIAISDGQWWRLLSANLLHTNLNHLLLNLAGLFLICALHKQHYQPLLFLILFCWISLVCTTGLYFFDTDLRWYVGLSGTLHGLMVWGAWRDIQSGMRSGWLLLLGTLGKIAYEQTMGANADIATLINAEVATNAHLFGAVGALIWIAGHYCIPGNSITMLQHNKKGS